MCRVRWLAPLVAALGSRQPLGGDQANGQIEDVSCDVRLSSHASFGRVEQGLLDTHLHERLPRCPS